MRIKKIENLFTVYNSITFMYTFNIIGSITIIFYSLKY